jgi:hypothetical protein
VCLDESPSLSLKTIPTQAPTPVPVRCVNEKGFSLSTPIWPGPAEHGDNRSSNPPAISLAKGSRAFRGIGGKIAGNPITGTGSVTAHTCPLA